MTVTLQTDERLRKDWCKLQMNKNLRLVFYLMYIFFSANLRRMCWCSDYIDPGSTESVDFFFLTCALYGEMHEEVLKENGIDCLLLMFSSYSFENGIVIFFSLLIFLYFDMVIMNSWLHGCIKCITIWRKNINKEKEMRLFSVLGYFISLLLRSCYSKGSKRVHVIMFEILYT